MLESGKAPLTLTPLNYEILLQEMLILVKSKISEYAINQGPIPLDWSARVPEDPSFFYMSILEEARYAKSVIV